MQKECQEQSNLRLHCLFRLTGSEIFRYLKNCCNYPEDGTVSFHYRVMGPKDADRMADPDLFVQKLRIITVILLQ